MWRFSKSFRQFALFAVVASPSLFIWSVRCVIAGQTGICRLLVWCFCPTGAMFAKPFYSLLGCLCSVGVRTGAELISRHTQQGLECTASLTHSLTHWARTLVASSKSLLPGKAKLFLLYWPKYWELTADCLWCLPALCWTCCRSLRSDSCQTTWPLSLGQPTSISSGLTCRHTAALGGDVSVA